MGNPEKWGGRKRKEVKKKLYPNCQDLVCREERIVLHQRGGCRCQSGRAEGEGEYGKKTFSPTPVTREGSDSKAPGVGAGARGTKVRGKRETLPKIFVAVVTYLSRQSEEGQGKNMERVVKRL